MFIFEITEVGSVVVSSAALLLDEFKAVWDADTSETKIEARTQFKYIEFMCSMKSSNPFAELGYEDKHKAVVKECWGEEYFATIEVPNPDTEALRPTIEVNACTYQPNELVQAALDKYVALDNKRLSIRMYKSAVNVVNKTTDYHDNMDFNKTNGQGMPMFKPKDVYADIDKLKLTMENLRVLRKEVDKEDYNLSKVKGKKNITPFER